MQKITKNKPGSLVNKKTEDTKNIDSTLSERKSQYGTFENNANITHLKNAPKTLQNPTCSSRAVHICHCLHFSHMDRE